MTHHDAPARRGGGSRRPGAAALTPGPGSAHARALMRLLRRLFCNTRALAALLLLTALVAGEAADARHHLSERGCPGDAGGRDGSCACASLHAAPIAAEPLAQPAPQEHEREFTLVAQALAPVARVVRGAAPRAPPRG